MYLVRAYIIALQAVIKRGKQFLCDFVDDLARKADEGTWTAYREPETLRLWFWNEQLCYGFFADTPGDWVEYQSAEGRRWWHHDVSGRWFFADLYSTCSLDASA